MSTTTIKTPGTPMPWMNAAVRGALKMPGLRSWLGKMFLVLTVTGAKTGKEYTIPVQYVRDGNRLLVTSQRHRMWWRNLRDPSEVEIVLQGRTIPTTARVHEGDTEMVARFLRSSPRSAKFYGIEVGADGEPDPCGLEQLDAAVVIIEIEAPTDAGG